MESQKLSFSRHHSYEIFLGSEILPELVGKLSRMGFHRRTLVVTNDVVAKWYLEPLTAELKKRNFEVQSIILPSGEAEKNLQNANRIYSQMIAFDIDRGSPLITLGGGVIGDLGGFVASTFKRGIPYIQFPTTLMAMVDASVGGKVAVNLPEGKNLVGSFYQPWLVGMDLSTLKTLPLAQLAYGLVECVKHAVLADPPYFKFIMKSRSEIKNKDIGVLQRLVRRSIHIKKAIVEEDEFEKGKRALLNMGNTFGHALEVLGEYRRFHHGEAVGLGILFALGMAKELGILKEDYSEAINEFLNDFDLPRKMGKEFHPNDIFEAMLRDKKRNQEEIRLVLPVALGQAEIKAVPASELKELLNAVIMNLY